MATATILHVFRLYHEQKNFLVNFSHKTFTRKSNKGDFTRFWNFLVKFSGRIITRKASAGNGNGYKSRVQEDTTAYKRQQPAEAPERKGNGKRRQREEDTTAGKENSYKSRQPAMATGRKGNGWQRQTSI